MAVLDAWAKEDAVVATKVAVLAISLTERIEVCVATRTI